MASINITSPQNNDNVGTTFTVSGNFTMGGGKNSNPITVEVVVTDSGTHNFWSGTLIGTTYSVCCTNLPLANGVTVVANLCAGNPATKIATSLPIDVNVQ